MTFTDFFVDLYSTVVIQNVDAEEPSPSGELNDDRNQAANRHTRAEQSGGATTKGGASTQSPLSGTNEESSEEAEVNKRDSLKRPNDESEDARTTVSVPVRSSDNKAGHESESSATTKFDENEDENKNSEDEKDRGEGEDEDEDEDEDEEDEPVDPKPIIEEECANSKQCSHHKDHYDTCVERVTQQAEASGKPKEDCVEEFFELAHCATQCAAPKLFQQLR